MKLIQRATDVYSVERMDPRKLPDPGARADEDVCDAALVSGEATRFAPLSPSACEACLRSGDESSLTTMRGPGVLLSILSGMISPSNAVVGRQPSPDTTT